MDFASALDTRVEDVKEPVKLPIGTYIWSVVKVPTNTRTKSNEWDIVEFQVRPISAEADVDSDALEAFGNLSRGQNRVSFMFPTAADGDADRESTLSNLTKFLTKTLRVDHDETTTVKEMMAQSVNHQFLAQASWRQVEDKLYVDVKNWAALD